jgi:hypothetical protein
MPEDLNSAQQRPPVSNYGSAVARALEWLGDRYLLAKPINESSHLRGRAAAAGYRHDLAREVR